MPRVVQVGQTGGVADWYSSLPPVTRFHGTAALIFMLASKLVVYPDVQSLVTLSWPAVFTQLQVWRPLTCFLNVGSVDINNFMRLLWIVMYGSQLESGTQFGNSTADYAWMYAFCMGAMLLLRLVPIWSGFLMGHPFSMMLVYLWSKHFPLARVSILGLVTIQGIYLPWAFMGVESLTRKAYMPHRLVFDCLGIATGHLYYFLKDIEPARSGRHLIRTPVFMQRLVQRFSASRVARQEVVQANATATGFRAFSGGGRRLTD